jgi:2-C-methyl-D-erythritol 4-phosphate cytidylyltransferase
VAAVKVTDTIKRVDKGMVVSGTVDRTKLWATQTPQAFKYELLKKAMETVIKKKVIVTDEASALELAGIEVRLVPSTPANIKVTTIEDFQLVGKLLR